MEIKAPSGKSSVKIVTISFPFEYKVFKEKLLKGNRKNNISIEELIINKYSKVVLDIIKKGDLDN